MPAPTRQSAPPPMPPPGAPPMPPGGEDVMAMEDQRAAATRDAMALAAPTPEPSGYTVKKLERLIDTLNKTVDFLGDEDLPDLTFEFVDPDGKPMKTWDQPLPDPLFPALMLLDQVARDLGFGDTYDLQLDELTNDTAVNMVTSKLAKMGKDKKLKRANLEGGATPGGEEDAEPMDEASPPAGAPPGEDEMAFLM